MVILRLVLGTYGKNYKAVFDHQGTPLSNILEIHSKHFAQGLSFFEKIYTIIRDILLEQ